MNFKEKNLEDIIYNAMINGDNDVLCNRGLNCYRKQILVKRQLRIGNYGKADLVTLTKCYDSYIISVYELKIGKIDLSSLIQVCRYVKGIKEYLREKYTEVNFAFEIILIGDSFCKKDWVYMFDSVIKNVQVYKYTYELEGIYFETVDLDELALINDGFKLSKNYDADFDFIK